MALNVKSSKYCLSLRYHNEGLSLLEDEVQREGIEVIFLNTYCVLKLSIPVYSTKTQSSESVEAIDVRFRLFIEGTLSQF